MTIRRFLAPQSLPSLVDRRASDRRLRVWWSLVYGNFRPRRRTAQRREDDFGHQALDWHAPHLLVVSIGILLLSAADAFMTVTLLADGASEINPVMALLIHKNAALFAALKMGMTGLGVLTMVYLAKYRFMRVLPVEWVMYAIFMVYLGLFGYEFWILDRAVDILEL